MRSKVRDHDIEGQTTRRRKRYEEAEWPFDVELYPAREHCHTHIHYGTRMRAETGLSLAVGSGWAEWSEPWFFATGSRQIVDFNSRAEPRKEKRL